MVKGLIGFLALIVFLVVTAPEKVRALCPSKTDSSCPETSPGASLNSINVPGIPTGGIDLISGTIVPNLINIFLFAVFVSSLVVLIVGGIMWVTSRGDKEGMAKAKGTVTYAIVGLVLGLGSFLILNVIGSLFGFNF